MRLDPEFLSRIQFAWVVGWHILLPAFGFVAAPPRQAEATVPASCQPCASDTL
jgi:hypothetical protein